MNDLSHKDRYFTCTDFAKSKNGDDYCDCCFTRSHGSNENRVCLYNFQGFLYEGGQNVTEVCGVRPVMNVCFEE